MTVTSKANLVNYTGSGNAGPFAITFPYGSVDELLIVRRDANYDTLELSIGDGIETIDGTGVTLSTALQSDERLLIQRQVNPSQELDITPHDRFSAADLENSLDLATRALVSLHNDLRRLEQLAIRFDYFSESRNVRMNREVVSNGYLKFNAACTQIDYADPDDMWLSEADIQAMIDSDVAALAADVANAFVEGVWHSAVAVTRDSVNGAGDATLEQLVSIEIPGGLMGPDDALEIMTCWTFVGADTKQVKVVFGTDALGAGGTVYADPPMTTHLNAKTHTLISNRGATDSQYGYNEAVATQFTIHASAAGVTSSVDTTATTYLSIQCGWDAAANSHSCTLEQYMVRLIRP
jgi:hypothetical protein